MVDAQTLMSAIKETKYGYLAICIFCAFSIFHAVHRPIRPDL